MSDDYLDKVQAADDDYEEADDAWEEISSQLSCDAPVSQTEPSQRDTMRDTSSVIKPVQDSQQSPSSAIYQHMKDIARIAIGASGLGCADVIPVTSSAHPKERGQHPGGNPGGNGDSQAHPPAVAKTRVNPAPPSQGSPDANPGPHVRLPLIREPFVDVSQPGPRSPSESGDGPVRTPIEQPVHGSDRHGQSGDRAVTINELANETKKVYIDDLSDKLTGLIGTNGKLTNAEKDKIYRAFDNVAAWGSEKELVEAVNKKLVDSGSNMRLIYHQPNGQFAEKSVIIADSTTGKVVDSMSFNLSIHNLSSVYPPPKPNWR